MRSLSRASVFSLSLIPTACAGGTMQGGTSVADTIDGSGDDGDDDGDDDGSDDGNDDATATAADDDADSADESPSDDEAGTDDGESADTGDDATGATTGEASDATTDEATTDGGEATTEDATTEDTAAESDDTGEPDFVDLSGFILVQTDSAREIVIPDNTIVPVGGAVVIGRDASLANFEDFWGVALPIGVVYVNGIDNLPTCNGDETFTLLTPLRTLVDGPSPPLEVSTSIARTDASVPADDPSAWSSSLVPNLDATPGTDDAAGGQTGVPYIAEVVDATGAGNYSYEFVEIRIAP